MADSRESGAERSPPPATSTRSEVSGTAEHVVQARDVRGGVHFHAPTAAGGPRPQQLPGDVRGFVNRATELARLDAVLPAEAAADGNVAVVVVTGTAGVGKTSLVVRWAHLMRGRFPDGQLYVNLRGYDPGEPVVALDALQRFLRALDVPTARIPADEQSRAALFRSLMADRRMLIVLDNAATVRQVRPLLPGTDSCLVLVSSRNRLSGLVALDGAERITVDPLSEHESIALLRMVTNGYRPTDDPRDLARLARLCAHLPLALRIAAERAAVRPHMLLSDLIEDLQDESALWDALSAEEDEAADAVRTVFAWSYRALAPDTARLFRLLGLHPGPEFSAAAAAALATVAPGRIRRLLDGLVGVHLLEQTGHDRYQFHDLLHAYATDQAHHEEPPERQLAALDRVVSWYLHAAAEAARTCSPATELPPIVLEPLDAGLVPMTFADYDSAIRWYDDERHNLVAATRAAAAAGLDALAWRIPAVLRTIHGSRDPVDTWLDAERVALLAARSCGDRYGEAVTQLGLGIAHRFLGRLTEAAQFYTAASALFDELHDPFGRMQAANGLGLIHRRERRLDQARADFERTAVSAREAGNDLWTGLAMLNLGETLASLGKLEAADANLAEAAARLRTCGERLYESEALTALAAVRGRRGLRGQARDLVKQALSIAHDHNNPSQEAGALLELARLQLVDNEAGAALVSAQQAAMYLRQRGDRNNEAAAWGVAGEAYGLQDALDESIAFYQRAAAAHRDAGDRWQWGEALDRLAAALLRVGNRAQAREQWMKSLEAIAGFTDPEAEALRARVVLALQATHRE